MLSRPTILTKTLNFKEGTQQGSIYLIRHKNVI